MVNYLTKCKKQSVKDQENSTEFNYENTREEGIHRFRTRTDKYHTTQKNQIRSPNLGAQINAGYLF